MLPSSLCLASKAVGEDYLLTKVSCSYQLFIRIQKQIAQNIIPSTFTAHLHYSTRLPTLNKHFPHNAHKTQHLFDTKKTVELMRVFCRQKYRTKSFAARGQRTKGYDRN